MGEALQMGSVMEKNIHIHLWHTFFSIVLFFFFFFSPLRQNTLTHLFPLISQCFPSILLLPSAHK